MTRSIKRHNQKAFHHKGGRFLHRFPSELYLLSRMQQHYLAISVVRRRLGRQHCTQVALQYLRLHGAHRISLRQIYVPQISVHSLLAFQRRSPLPHFRPVLLPVQRRLQWKPQVCQRYLPLLLARRSPGILLALQQMLLLARQQLVLLTPRLLPRWFLLIFTPITLLVHPAACLSRLRFHLRPRQ